MVRTHVCKLGIFKVTTDGEQPSQQRGWLYPEPLGLQFHHDTMTLPVDCSGTYFLAVDKTGLSLLSTYSVPDR